MSHANSPIFRAEVLEAQGYRRLGSPRAMTVRTEWKTTLVLLMLTSCVAFASLKVVLSRKTKSCGPVVDASNQPVHSDANRARDLVVGRKFGSNIQNEIGQRCGANNQYYRSKGT